jgi:RNA polymerase sigma factor (sigma-70 family)
MWDNGVKYETDEIFRIIHQYAELPAEEQIRLARLAQSGDTAARDRLILTNLRLVVAKVKPWMTAQDMSDVVHEGVIGMFEALKRFNPNKGYHFSTYVVHWIQQSARNWAYQQTMLSDSRYTHDQANRVKMCLRDGLTDPQLIAERAKISLKTVHEIIAFACLTPLSLDRQVTQETESAPFHCFIQDEQNHLAALEDADELVSWLSVLNEREREIIHLRFGIGTDEDGCTFPDIAQSFGVSTQRATQIYNRAIEKLQKEAGVTVTPKDTNKKTKKTKSEVA